jgi:hypothetical protein
MNLTLAVACIFLFAPTHGLAQSSPFPDEDSPIGSSDAKSNDVDPSVEDSPDRVLNEPISADVEATSSAGTTSKSLNSVGVGFGFPDATTILADRQLFGGLITIQGFYSLPIEYSLNVRVPADDEALETRLKAGTPETIYPITVRYLSNFGLNFIVRPLTTMLPNAYLYAGAGYRKVQVTTNGRSDLFICLRTADIPCDKEHESFPSRSEIELTADIEAVSYTARAGMGYQWTVSNRLKVDWSIFGLLKPFPQSTSMLVESELHREESEGEETNEILEQMDVYLDKKRESIRNRVVNNVQIFDQKLLPISTLAVSYAF